MPFLIGELGLLVIFGFILLLFTTYWVLVHARDISKDIPVIGGGIAGVFNYVAQRNAELIRGVWGAASGVMLWCHDRVVDGHFAVDMPPFNDAGPCARKINLAKFDEMGICGLQHVHNFSPLIWDLLQRYNFDSIYHDWFSRFNNFSDCEDCRRSYFGL